MKKNKSKKRYPVIGITLCEKEKNTLDTTERYAQRIAINKQTLIDINRDVENWRIDATPGELIYLTIENKEKIIKADQICYNTSFQK